MTAGAWYSSSGIGDANQALTTKMIQLAIDASIKNVDFVGAPVMQAVLAKDEGLGELMGALGVQMSLASLGNAYLSTAAEGTQNAATNTSASNVTLTPARKDLVRAVSDYARSIQRGLLTGELGGSAQAALILDGYRAWVNTLATNVVGLADSASYTIGTTGTALTWLVLQNGILDMVNRGAPGPYVCALSVKGIKDLASDAISLGGAVQMSGQIQQFLQAGMRGSYIGRFFGSTDLYMTSECDSPSTDDEGFLFSGDGVVTKHAMVPFSGAAIQLVNAGFYRMELRRADGATDNVVTDSYSAFGIGDPAAAARVLYAES